MGFRTRQYLMRTDDIECPCFGFQKGGRENVSLGVATFPKEKKPTPTSIILKEKGRSKRALVEERTWCGCELAEQGDAGEARHLGGVCG